MIVKVQLSRGWMFISEVYQIETEDMTKDKAIALDFNKEFYCTKNGEEKDLKTDWVKLINIFTKISTEQRLDKVIVVDTNKVYLLNNEGKTIERLN